MINTTFLLTEDYDPQIRKDILCIITDDTDGLRTQSERAAIAQVKTILAYRHDIECIFPTILPHYSSVQYSAGDNVLFEGVLYVALNDTIGVEPPTCWLDSDSYDTGEFVILNQTTYQVIQDSPAGTHPSDPVYFSVVSDPDWALSTSRNPYLIMILVDIVLYHLHARISPNNIPKIRLDRYDEAMTWLKQVSKGEASLSECLIKDEEGEEVGNITWGSKSRNENCY